MMSTRRFSAISAFLLIYALLGTYSGYDSYSASAAKSDPGSRFFPETAHTVKGTFLTYWTDNGGLAQQGYPISEEIQEASDVDGKTRTVQYFERALFELHPENQPPYDVLLTLLGRLRYQEKYSQFAPIQKPNTSEGSVFFPETGKRLGGSFFLYWQQYGGLQQQGYPISDEIQETSDLDGATYTVQYFERSVMEWHPGNTPPNDVLLSQLGLFRYKDKYQQPVFTPTVIPTPNNGAKLIAEDIYGKAIATDRYIFWVADDKPVFSLYGYDLSQNKQFLVSNTPGYKGSLVIDGTKLVWFEGDVEGLGGINGYDIDTQAAFTVVAAQMPSAVNGGNMSLVDNVLYYVSLRLNNIPIDEGYGIIARNLATGEEKLVATRAYNPVVTSTGLLFAKEVSECSPNSSRPPCTFVQQLYLREGFDPASDKLLATIAGQSHFETYTLNSDYAIWTAPSFDLKGNIPFVLSRKSGEIQALSSDIVDSPVLTNTSVAWAVEPTQSNTLWSLQVYDLSAATVTTLLSQSAMPIEPQAFAGEGKLVYVGVRPGDLVRDLYVMNTTP